MHENASEFGYWNEIPTAQVKLSERAIKHVISTNFFEIQLVIEKEMKAMEKISIFSVLVR